MKIKLTLFFLSIFCATAPLYAETKAQSWSDKHGIEYRLQVSYNIGAATPIPIPAEIREFKSYNPGFHLSLDAVIIKWFYPYLGAGFNLRLENRGMETDVRVKNYKMQVTDGGSAIEGYWTGSVETTLIQYSIGFTIPVLWKPSPKWELQLGPFFSWMLSGKFSGYAYDGYLRVGDPTGDKVEITGDSKARYDFSDELNIFNWGIEVGALWKPIEYIGIRLAFTYGFRSILNKDFDTISFPMNPIYIHLGVVYIF